MNTNTNLNQEFETWNKLKQKIHKKKKLIFAKEGEIYWISFGKNIGSEAVGKGDVFSRPGVIIKELYKGYIVLPLTTTIREGSYFFNFQDSKGIMQSAILSQIKFVDIKRIKGHISQMEEKDFKQLRNKLQKFLS